MLTREQGLDMLRAHNAEEHLIRHALASEAVLRSLAEKLGEDAALWGMAGLMHDLDYPRTQTQPERHGLDSALLLEGHLPEPVLSAVRAHNELTGTFPATPLDYALRCGATITGLVAAAALLRPTGLDGMEAASLKKKMKDKSFAASVSRERIRECEHIGLDLGDLLSLASAAMAPHASVLGLAKTRD